VSSIAVVTTEERRTFACFGGECTVIAAGDGAGEAVAEARSRLLLWHRQFSRFEPDSELSRLNGDGRETVPVTPLMRRIVDAGIRAAHATAGLVDPTLGAEIERAGYGGHLAAPGIGLHAALALAPPRAPAGSSAAASWRLVSADRRTGTVTRPPGLKLDPGGIAKGVFADELASLIRAIGAFVIDCAGDLRLGGAGALARDVHVESPFDGSIVHTFSLATGGVATSGIGRRRWIGSDRRPAHHLLDPATGRPAFTGVVQATALAPTATAAEALSKAALLSGPAGAEQWLADGGVLVLDDGSVRVVAAG
jgi:FAD:protein FMN transferase